MESRCLSRKVCCSLLSIRGTKIWLRSKNCHSTQQSRRFPLQQVVIHMSISPAGAGFSTGVNQFGHRDDNPRCPAWWPHHAVCAKNLLQVLANFYACLWAAGNDKTVSLMNLNMCPDELVSPDGWCCTQRDAAKRVFNANTGDRCHYRAQVCCVKKAVWFT